MAILSRHCVSLRALRSQLTMLLIAVAICSLVCTMRRVSVAAPVTFRFEAEIVSVTAGSPFDLSLDYKVGDTISGRFSFESGAGLPIGDNAIAADQLFALEFNINGNVVRSSGHHIRVFDNTPILDSDFESPVDMISLGCSEPSCIPNFVVLPTREPFRVRSRMSLIGRNDVLDAPLISNEPTIWNAFVLERKLSLNFDNAGPGSVGLLAEIRNFSAVPEPDNRGLSLFVFLVGTAAIIVRGFRPRRKLARDTYFYFSTENTAYSGEHG